jgi:hypothetical protein
MSVDDGRQPAFVPEPPRRFARDFSSVSYKLHLACSIPYWSLRTARPRMWRIGTCMTALAFPR